MGRPHTSRPPDVSWGNLSDPAGVPSREEVPQAVGVEELKPSHVSVPVTSMAGRSGGVGGLLPSQTGMGVGEGSEWEWERDRHAPATSCVLGLDEGCSYKGWGLGSCWAPLAREHFPLEVQAPWGCSPSHPLQGQAPLPSPLEP